MIVARRYGARRLAAYVGRPLALLLGWDVAVVLAYRVLRPHWGGHWGGLGALPMSMMGSSLAIFLVLRNNVAYARWWEARTLWGGVVGGSRRLARQSRLFLAPADAQALVRLQVAFAHALRCHLRRLDPWAAVTPFLPAGLEPALRARTNLPDAILSAMADRLAALARAGALDSVALAAFEDTLREIGSAQGGCERIRNTPLPRQYDAFPALFVQLFCVLLPLSMVDDLAWLTPLGSSVVGFVFLALDTIGRRLEDPFENDSHDVPLDALARTIEIDLRQGIGETGLPPPLLPVDGVLW